MVIEATYYAAVLVFSKYLTIDDFTLDLAF